MYGVHLFHAAFLTGAAHRPTCVIEGSVAQNRSLPADNQRGIKESMYAARGMLARGAWPEMASWRRDGAEEHF